MASEMWHNDYTVLIERLQQPRFTLNPSSGKLRFEISSHSTNLPSDPNNNTNNSTDGIENTSVRKLACFELLEDGIRSIRVVPTGSQQSFNVECIKSNGPTAETSTSVQVIHKRNGQLHHSNENISLIYVPTDRNLVRDQVTPLSTFQGGTKNHGAANNISVTSMADFVISETDLRAYNRFTFKFTSILERSLDSHPPIAESTNAELNGNISKDDATRIYENISDDISEYDYLSDWSKINLQAVFDDVISITLEMHNLFSQNKPSSSRLGATNDFYFQNQSIPPTGFRERRLRDFREIGRAQAVFEQHNAINLNQTALQSPWHKSYTKAHFVRKFVKSIVKHRLQALGVQQLDCNEIIDKWEAKQSNPFSFLFPKDDDLNEGEWNHAGMISPLISKPNSDLFHLSPSGHITKSIFSTFVNQVETLKGILNNATCNLVHTQVCLLLPEIKLLWGRQLDTNRNPVFILEWMRLIILAGVELDPTSPEQVLVMINRELKTLRNLSNQLYKSSKKVFHKIESLSKFSEEIFRKTLAQLNPKSLKKLDAFNNAMRKKYSPDVIHFDPDQLHKIRIAPADLFQDHLFLSETHKGELLVKNDIDGFWGKYLDLEFADRRTIFLGMTDDLQTTLRACLHTVQHLQEIYTTGYPGSIKNLLKDVVQELKFTSKRDDLTLLIKTSIVTHVSCLHEMLTRLLCISKEVKGVTKQFTECLQPASFDLKKLKRQFKKRDKKSCEVSDTDTTTFSGFYHYNNFAAGSGNSNAQLVIPFSSLSVDLAFKSHTLNDSV